jgi:hypothetical protein
MQQSAADDDAKAEDSKVTRNFILELAPQPDISSSSSGSSKAEVSSYALLYAIIGLDNHSSNASRLQQMRNIMEIKHYANSVGLC